MDYVKIMKYGNIINLTFNIEQDKPFDIGEKMNEICADAYMNGYNWEAFFNILPWKKLSRNIRGDRF